MSAAIKEAAVKEALELSYAFRQNAALRNGLPDCKRIPFDLPNEPPPKQEPPVVNVTNNIPAAVKESPSPGAAVAEAVKSSLLRRAAPWLLTALGAGGTTVGLGWLLGDKVETPPAVVQPGDEDGSLLQWLQDQGRHVPGGEWPTK